MSAANASNEEQYELLCAYILGEANENERAEIEAALAASAELRAEKERLEGTIGLVRDVYSAEPTLSEQALAELMDAAGGAPPLAPVISIWSRPEFRAAAAVVAMLGGVWGLLQFAESDSGGVSTSSLEVAQAEPVTAKERVLEEVEEIASDARARRSLLGFEVAGQPADEPSSGPEKAAGEGGRVARFSKADETPPHADGAEVEWTGQHLYELTQETVRPGLSQDADPVAIDFYGGLRVEAEMAPPEESVMLSETLKKQSAGSVAAVELPRTAPERELQLSYDTQTQNTDKSVAIVGKPVAGSDDFFLGRGVNVRARNEGTYRGAGDAVPVGGKGGGGGGAQGPAGPGSPGPASPGAPAGAPAGGPASPSSKNSPGPPARARVPLASVLPVLRDGETLEQRKALDALGYGSGETDADDDGRVDGAVQGWLGGADGKDRNFRYKQGLSAAQLQELIERECRTRIRGCYPRPNERPSMMYFRFWGDNAFELAQLDALSTFSVDVDTASYALARRYLEGGTLPEKAQIRTEEFLNYFKPDLDAPTEATFNVSTELAPSLFGGREDRWMLRVGVRGREVSASERKPLALTFIIDTSGSMKEGGRLELVKHALRLLLGQLDARDSIAVVAFGREARLILPMTSAAQRGLIESALYPLTPSGGTNAEAGLKMGYEAALAGLANGAHNRVIFLSDGVANIGQTDQDRLNADVQRHKDQGIYLNTIGVGMNNHNDVFLEQLADKGDGICDYIDDAEAARRAIVDRFAGAFEPIASDVKIQVEFDPLQVHRYRLLGYENRAIADKDFRNDKVDAGEVGSGHQVVALYEIERTSAAADGPLATVRLRWKAPKVAGQDPNEVDVTEVYQAVLPENAAGTFGGTSPGYRRSVLVAQFAEFLRRSTHTQGDSYETLMIESAKLDPELADPDFTEFRGLVERTATLIMSTVRPRTELTRALDEFRRFQILQAELRNLERSPDGKLLEDLKRKNQELEDSLRDMIRKDLEERNG